MRGQAAGADLARLEYTHLAGVSSEIGRVHNKNGIRVFAYYFFQEVFRSNPGVYACGGHAPVDFPDKHGTGAVVSLVDVSNAQDEDAAGEDCF